MSRIRLKYFSFYGIPYFVLLAIVLGLLYTYPKEELHLLMNAHHTAIGDFFFKYYSILAEWPLYVLALLPVFWRKTYMTVFFTLSELTGGVVTQILKHLFSSDRPVVVFEHNSQVLLPLVQGVEMHHSNSFPSGHTSTFFVFFTCCALILAYYYSRQEPCLITLRRKCMIRTLMLVLLIMAALGAYSRVYLSQHFMSDVCVGSIIGFVMPCMYFFFARDKILKLSNRLHKTK